jgi:phosphatidylglycerophosphate synthase
VFAAGWHGDWFVCLIAYAIGLASDAVDGRLARATHTTTPFGRAMDSAADKTMVAAAMLALTASGRLWILLTFLFIAREFAVFGLRAIRPPGGATIAEIADAVGRLRFLILHVGIVALLLSGGPRWLGTIGSSALALSTALAYSGLLYYIARDWPTLRNTMRKAEK